MIRNILMAMFCVSLAACNGSGDDTPAGSSAGGNVGESADLTAFDPTAMTVDVPPTNGKLPAELLPPV